MKLVSLAVITPPVHVGPDPDQHLFWPVIKSQNKHSSAAAAAAYLFSALLVMIIISTTADEALFMS